MLRLQHAPEKSSLYRDFAPIVWSEDLRAWCVFDPELITVLGSSDFTIPDGGGRYPKLGQQYPSRG